MPKHMEKGHYGRLGAMIALSFVAMYVLMYAMVDAFANVYMSLNQIYMAAVMAAPMALIELWLMRGMYPNKKLNGIFIAASIIALVIFFVLIRQQTAIGDRQFLRSMIPHHAGAILMCGEAPIKDLEIAKLCKSIISSQQREIDQMKRLLAKLDK